MALWARQRLPVDPAASTTTSMISCTCSCVCVLEWSPRRSATASHTQPHDEARKKEREDRRGVLFPSTIQPLPGPATAHHPLPCKGEGTVTLCIVPVPGCVGYTRGRGQETEGRGKSMEDHQYGDSRTDGASFCAKALWLWLWPMPLLWQ